MSRDEQHPYPSPTTPGLAVSFKDLCVELVCLNMNSRLPARFWRDKGYWASKYARECRGFAKFAKLHDEIDDPVFQRAVVAAIKQLGNRSLLREDTLARLDRIVQDHHAKLLAQRTELASKLQPALADPESYMRNNARAVGDGGLGRLEKIRGIECEQRKDQEAGHV